MKIFKFTDKEYERNLLIYSMINSLIGAAEDRNIAYFEEGYIEDVMKCIPEIEQALDILKAGINRIESESGIVRIE